MTLSGIMTIICVILCIFALTVSYLDAIIRGLFSKKITPSPKKKEIETYHPFREAWVAEKDEEGALSSSWNYELEEDCLYRLDDNTTISTEPTVEIPSKPAVIIVEINLKRPEPAIKEYRSHIPGSPQALQAIREFWNNTIAQCVSYSAAQINIHDLTSEEVEIFKFIAQRIGIKVLATNERSISIQIGEGQSRSALEI